MTVKSLYTVGFTLCFSVLKTTFLKKKKEFCCSRILLCLYLLLQVSAEKTQVSFLLSFFFFSLSLSFFHFFSLALLSGYSAVSSVVVVGAAVC